MRDAHLKELTSLCLKDDNLILVHNLKNAFDEAWIQSLQELFKDIERSLEYQIRNLPEEGKHSDISEQRIRKVVTGRGIRQKFAYVFD